MEEALRDGREAARARGNCRCSADPCATTTAEFSQPRWRASRAKLKYRPVIFELMNDAFTLTALQRTVEAISGRHLHKQNFRRLVETAALVEPTGDMSTLTGGRPAALFRFRREVIRDQPSPGLRLSALTVRPPLPLAGEGWVRSRLRGQCHRCFQIASKSPHPASLLLGHPLPQAGEGYEVCPRLCSNTHCPHAEEHREAMDVSKTWATIND